MGRRRKSCRRCITPGGARTPLRTVSSSCVFGSLEGSLYNLARMHCVRWLVYLAPGTVMGLPLVVVTARSENRVSVLAVAATQCTTIISSTSL